MRTKSFITSLVAISSLLATAAHAEEPPWISLFNGKTLDKRVVTEGPVRIVDGRLELSKPGGLKYKCQGADFKNFDFVAEVLTESGAKCRIDFTHVISGVGPPLYAAVAIDNSRDWDFRHGVDYGKTGSLVLGRWQFKSVAKDGEWFTLRIRLEDRQLCVWVKDKLVTDVKGPKGGGFCILPDSPGSKISFRSLRFQNLKGTASNVEDAVKRDEIDRQMAELRQRGFPLINYHIHLKGDLTLEKALAHSRETGVFYGIAANCGVNFPITNDQGINDYIKKLEGQPCFIGMQAEGREWPTLFSKEAIAKFDYIFSDAMTIVDHRGKRARLWMPDGSRYPRQAGFHGTARADDRTDPRQRTGRYLRQPDVPARRAHPRNTTRSGRPSGSSG